MLTDKAALEVEAGAAVDEGTAWIEVTGVARGVETMDSIDVCEEKPYPVSSESDDFAMVSAGVKVDEFSLDVRQQRSWSPGKHDIFEQLSDPT